MGSVVIMIGDERPVFHPGTVKKHLKKDPVHFLIFDRI